MMELTTGEELMKLNLLPIMVVVSLLTLYPSWVLAQDPVDKKVEQASKQWEKAQADYRDALKEKREFLDKEINRLEKLIEDQDDKIERKKLLDNLNDRLQEREFLRDELDIINAGEVVKLSNAKNKVIAFLTKQ